MATVTVPLEDGFKVGDVTHHEIVLRELAPADIVEASLESERAVMTENGYQFMVSPTLMGINTLLRQLESVGDFKGPFTRSMLSQLSRYDFEVLQTEAELIDQAVMEAVAQRGRHDAPGGETGIAHDSNE